MKPPARAAGQPRARPLRARPIRAQRIADHPESVFARYARMAAGGDVVNLGQGFPDDPPAKVVLEAYRRALDGAHQYAPSAGRLDLRRAVAAQEGARLGRSIDPEQEVLVTVGASEALYAAVLALVDPGDEVLLVEPFYEAYLPLVRMAGGVPVGVPLELGGDRRWRLDPERLAAAVGPRTRLVLLNEPHNPTGALLGEEAGLALLAAAERHGAWVVVDEVYQHLAFRPYRPFATLPGAAERTLVIGSAAKSFGVTGWKVGWVSGPAPLVEAMRTLRQWVSFAVATPLQAAVAELLAEVGNGGEVDRSLLAQRDGMRARRDRLIGGLEAAGLPPTLPDGGYFVLADASGLGMGSDVELCDVLPGLAGLVAIPASPFHLDPLAAARRGWVRFAYCRGDATVDAGIERLSRLRSLLNHQATSAT